MDAFVGGLLLLIGLAVGAYFRGRYSKAGEIDAINSRLNDIVRHAEATTYLGANICGAQRGEKQQKKPLVFRGLSCTGIRRREAGTALRPRLPAWSG
jgi:hypothetical protein